MRFFRKTSEQVEEWAPLSSTDISDFTAAVSALTGGGGGGVASVNGDVGPAVTLTASSVGAVPTTRTITAGTGLSGGGDLSANRSVALADTAVTPGSYTSANVTVDQQGRILSASNGTGGSGGANSGLPSYAPSLVGTFDPLRSFYVSGTDSLGAWRAALGRARAGLGYAHVLVIGDSHADGKMDDTLSGGSNWQTSAWSEIVKAKLILDGVPDGGTGWVKFGGLLNPPDPRWATAGNAFTGRTGQSLKSWGVNNTAGATATLTLSQGDGVLVEALFSLADKPWTLAAQTSAGAAVSSITTNRDGTSTLSVQSSAGTGIGKLVATTLTGTGGNWRLGGGQIRRASGLLVSNWAISNSVATSASLGWDQSIASGSSTFDWEGAQATMLTPAPDLIMCQLGGNDDLQGVTDSAITTALATILNRWPNASKLIVFNWGADDTNRHNMAGAYYTLADTLSCGFFDTLRRTGGSTLMNTRGLYNAGTSLIHPNQAGHATLGYALADVLLS